MRNYFDFDKNRCEIYFHKFENRHDFLETYLYFVKYNTVQYKFIIR